MTNSDSVEFDQFRLNAAKIFAQSMIFVDDEASQAPDQPVVRRLMRPPEGIKAIEKHGEQTDEHDTEERTTGFKFNAKLLIDNAMDMGLICSVLRPIKDEEITNRVVKAARVADIVCLDWDIYGDGGNVATEIIRKILQDDVERNGRIRLIAIYTADFANKDRIMTRVWQEIPNEIRQNLENCDESLEINSDHGVRIVCLFKMNGVKLDSSVNSHQVSEDQLPSHLQLQFAKLSEGLLSNTAIATVASLRNSTHHVLSRFVGAMDGPFFHHRALINNTEDAEEYAVNIVLSELKASVNKRQIGAEHAGHKAIDARIRELATDLGQNNELELLSDKPSSNDETKTGQISYKLPTDFAIEIVSKGLLSCRMSELTVQPPKKIIKNFIYSMFAENLEIARSRLYRFAALTSVQAHPESFLCQSGTWVPELGLGTVILEKDDKGESYLLCLQASCDSVRIELESNFLFVRMEKAKSEKPDHVVPVSIENESRVIYVGFNISCETYRSTCTIKFSSCDETETVNARKIGNSRGFYFKDTDEKQYRWIADLKHRRALRTAQRLGSEIGRLGFEEFEPLRK